MVKAVDHHPYQWAQQALERLHRDELTPNPNHYALFYYYFAGNNPQLKVAVDRAIAQHDRLTAELCEDLYQAHLGLAVEQRMLKETSTAIEAQVSRVLQVIDQSNAGASQYGETLSSFSGELAAAPSLDQVRDAVTKVASDTRAMTQQSERLAEQLASATQQLGELRQNFEQAHKELQIDPLTEIGNRKFFDMQLAQAMADARETGAPLTLLMADIDHFKKFNDTYGHVIGDQVLRLVAKTLVENLKGRDVIARYGGEEFVILLPQTRVADAGRVADLLRASLAGKSLRKRDSNETLGVITISIGAAEYCPGEDRDSLVARADAGMYRAKQGGRNRAVLEILPPEEIAAIAARRTKS